MSSVGDRMQKRREYNDLAEDLLLQRQEDRMQVTDTPCPPVSACTEAFKDIYTTVASACLFEWD